MKYYIPIDRSTVKDNPGVHYLPGKMTKRESKVIREDGLSFIATYVNDVLVDKRQVTAEEASVFGFRTSLTFDCQSVYSPPSKNYEYVPTEVTCCACKAAFPHTQLRSEEVNGLDDDGYDDWYAVDDRVCPKCNAWSCCEIEFEKL